MEVSGQLNIPVILTSLLTIKDSFHGNRYVRDWMGPKGRTERFGEALATAERKICCCENIFQTHKNTVRIFSEVHDLV